MKKNFSNLIGYYMGNEVRVKDGVPYLVEPSEAEKINRRVSEINWELKHAVQLLQHYTEIQIELRRKVREEFDTLGHYKQEKLKSDIRKHRAVLNGLKNHIVLLKAEKMKLQKSHPKLMKPKELTPEEKAIKKQKKENGHKIAKLKSELFKLDNDCRRCHGNFNDDCRDCWALDKRSDLKQEIEKLTKK